MSSFQKELQSDDWKKNLQDGIISSMTGNALEKTSAQLCVGYHYLYSAPASLFKYFKGEKRDLESIKTNKMWYSAPCKYNDVFDCEIAIDESALFNCALQLAPEGVKISTGSHVWKNLQKTLRQQTKSFRSTLEKLRSEMGIACLSESDESLLMWAHYADNHCGICVEYDLMEIHKQLHFSPVPVIYSNERVCFNTLNPSTIENDALALFLRCIMSKSEKWCYEREWRIIRDKAACGDRWNAEENGALLDSICPSSITLGCAAGGELEDAVRAYCKERKVPLFKMQKDDTQYKLNKVTILEFDT